jgi:hypothetical protein
MRMEALPPTSVLSPAERDRLTGLLAAVPASRRWAVTHMHAPLLCALGLASAPDPSYARAAHRFFADPEKARRRALALLDELDRDHRRDEQRRSAPALRRRFH